MKTFKMENNDYVLDDTNNLVMIDEMDEVRQSVERICTTNIREWFLNMEYGLDYEAIEGKGKDRAIIELALRTAIFQDTRIIDIHFNKVELNRATRHLQVKLDAVTDKGVIEGIEVII